MGVYIKENMLVIREPRTVHFNFDLPKDFNKNLIRKTTFIIKYHESLAEYEIKDKTG